MNILNYFLLNILVQVIKTDKTIPIKLSTLVKSNSDKTNQTINNVDESKIIHHKLTDGINIYKKIVNPHPYKLTINPGKHFCGPDKGKNVYLLIVVNSDPAKFQFRSSQRDTWAKRSMFPDVRFLFLMGQPANSTLNKRLLLEHNLYRDILQGDFFDSYRNLSIKGVMSLKWTHKYCSNIRYFVKTDDDVIIDVFLMLNHLKKMDSLNFKPKKSILCAHIGDRSMPVLRDPGNKWYVSKKEYEPDWFSEYCSGLGYIITRDLIYPMLNVSQYVKFVWVDDFFMSGVLGKATNSSYINLGSLYSVFDLANSVIFRYALNPTFSRLFIHLKDIRIRNLIWFYIVEKQLNGYLNKYSFKSIQIQEFGVFDDYFWMHDDYWNKTLLINK